jgi:hypothetical protein
VAAVPIASQIKKIIKIIILSSNSKVRNFQNRRAELRAKVNLKMNIESMFQRYLFHVSNTNERKKEYYF